jgi:hypothetical protein
MTSQDYNVMITRVFNHLPLAIKMNVTEKNFVESVEKLDEEFLFYDKAEYFRQIYCEMKLSNQNPQVMIPRIYNALPLKIKQIECEGIYKKY